MREHRHGRAGGEPAAPPGAGRLGIPAFFWGGGAGFGAFVVRNAGRHRSSMAATSPVHPWVSLPRVGAAMGGGDTPADATQPAWPWLTSGCPSWVLLSRHAGSFPRGISIMAAPQVLGLNQLPFVLCRFIRILRGASAGAGGLLGRVSWDTPLPPPASARDGGCLAVGWGSWAGGHAGCLCHPHKEGPLG